MAMKKFQYPADLQRVLRLHRLQLAGATSSVAAAKAVWLGLSIPVLKLRLLIPRQQLHLSHRGHLSHLCHLHHLCHYLPPSGWLLAACKVNTESYKAAL
jgi:hypothetical protein